MTETPPATPGQGRADAGSLRLLAALHFAMAGLCAAGIGFLVWHYLRMHNAFLDISPKKGKDVAGTQMGQFLETFKWFYLISGGVLVVVGAADLFSGRLICRRRWRRASLLIACLNCVVVPVGTILAAFTMVVLLRDSVRGAYAARPAAPHPSGG